MAELLLETDGIDPLSMSTMLSSKDGAGEIQMAWEELHMEKVPVALAIGVTLTCVKNFL